MKLYTKVVYDRRYTSKANKDYVIVRPAAGFTGNYERETLAIPVTLFEKSGLSVDNLDLGCNLRLEYDYINYTKQGQYYSYTIPSAVILI